MSYAGRTKKIDNSVQNRIISLNLTLPQDEDLPTGIHKQALIPSVSHNIALELPLPELLA